MNQLKQSLPYYFLPICSVICIFMTGFNSYYWNDDFNYLSNIGREGFFMEAYHQYVNWDGRVISPLFIIRNIFLFYFPPQVLVVLGLISMFITARLIALILQKLSILSDKSVNLGLVLFFGTLLWFGYQAHIARSVYWATGSYYIFANTLLFLWINLYLKKSVPLIPFLILTFTVLSSGVNIGVMVIVIVFFLHVLKARKIKIKKDIFVLLTIILAFSLSTFAPGNLNRAQSNYSGIDLKFTDLIVNYFIVFKEYLFMSKWIFIFAILFGLVLSSIKNLKLSNTRILWIIFVLILVGLSSITPFIFVPEAASKHTSVHFQTCLFISICLFVIYVLDFGNFKVNKWFIIFLINSISLFLVIKGAQQFVFGRQVKQQIEKRYDYLETKRNSKDTIFLVPIMQPDNFFTNRVWDVANPSNDSNSILENYFKTGPIYPVIQNKD